jgi:hypothetical protein
MTTPAVSAKEKARERIEAIADILKQRDEALFTGDAYEADDDEREDTAEVILAALSAKGEAEPVACGVYPPPETYGGSPNDEWTGRPPSAPAGVKVKPLEWHAHPGDWWSAQSILGEYAHGNAGWYGPDGSVHGAPGKEACQAAAQADYEQRIRSSLQPDTQAHGGGVEAVRDAVARIIDPHSFVPYQPTGAPDDVVFADMVKSSLDEAYRKADRIIAALAASPAAPDAAGVDAREALRSCRRGDMRPRRNAPRRVSLDYLRSVRAEVGRRRRRFRASRGCAGRSASANDLRGAPR